MGVEIKYDDEDGSAEIRLSSGKSIYVANGTIGLTLEGSIAYGHDTRMELFSEITPEDLIEISNYMVSRWLEVGLRAEEEIRQDDSKERESEAEDFFNGC